MEVYFSYLKSKTILACLFMLIVLLGGGSISNQAVANGEINTFVAGIIFLDNNGNTIQDVDELALSGYSVWLESTDGNSTFQAFSGVDGMYVFPIHNLGSYNISVDLNGMNLTSPFFAEKVMPAYPVTVSQKGQTVQVDFGLSSEDASLLLKNKDNSVIISNQDYNLKITPNFTDATTVSPMSFNVISSETIIGTTNTSEVTLIPNTAKDARKKSSRSSDDVYHYTLGKNISGTGEESSYDVKYNQDGSVTLTNPAQSTAQLTLAGDKFTLVDSEFPTLAMSSGDGGNFAVSDSEFPDTQLIIQPDGTQFVIDSEFPGMSLTLNDDQTYTILDEEFPELITLYNPTDKSYQVTDTKENLTFFVDQAGHYTVIDNLNNVCVDMSSMSKTRSLFSSLFNKIKSIINKIASFIAKVANFVSKVANFVKKALPFIIVGLKVISVVTKFLAPIFPPLCPILCAISAFADGAATFLTVNKGKITAFLDTTIKIAGQVEKGATAVANATASRDGRMRRAARTSSLPNENCAELPVLVLDYLVGSAQMIYNELTWATVVESSNNKGFNLWRARKNEAGEFIDLVQINTTLIPAKEGAQWGAQYHFVDENITFSQVYYYFLETVDIHDNKTKQMDFIAEVKSVASKYALSCGIYGVQDKALNDSVFFKYDFLSGITTIFGDICKGCDIEAMAIHPVTHELFVASGNDAVGHPKGYLYKINLGDRLPLPVGSTGFAGITSLTFDKFGTLWAWAENEGLAQIDPVSGKGKIILPSTLKMGDLTWSLDGTVLYGALGSELWQYNPTTGDVALVCSNLPKKTEALTTFPSDIFSGGYLLSGSHQVDFQIGAVNPANDCKMEVSRNIGNIGVPFDDVEGLAISTLGCVNQ